MPKSVVTAKLDQSILDEIDTMAVRIGETRSACVEKLILIGLREREEVVRLLERELLGGIQAAMLSSEPVMRALSNLAGEEFDVDEFEGRNERIKRIRESRPRAQTRKGKKDES